MNEYELLNLMYLFFISNAMNFVGFVILIWLGFRFAANIYENQSTDMVGKVMVSLFYVSVAVLMTFNGMTGASVLSAYTEQLAQIGSEAVPRLQAAADNPEISRLRKFSLVIPAHRSTRPARLSDNLLPLLRQLLASRSR